MQLKQIMAQFFWEFVNFISAIFNPGQPRMAQCCENWLWLVSCCGCRQRYVWDNISTSPQPAPTCPWRRIIKNWFLASNKDSVSPPPSQPPSVKLGFRAAHLNKHLKIFIKGEHVQNIFVQWWAVDSDVNIFNKNIWRYNITYVFLFYAIPLRICSEAVTLSPVLGRIHE